MTLKAVIINEVKPTPNKIIDAYIYIYTVENWFRNLSL